ncbi:MAG: epimerase [Xanthobacteraceae bacterium]|nr:epimerase [Xanthobacteraceae bacterium]
MKIILFGASGMIGQAAMRECLLDPGVTQVLSIVRSPSGKQHDKLREIVRADLMNVSDIEPELAGYDACFYCVGISSVGMKEADYRVITYDMPLAAGAVLARQNPDMTFVYVSASGADPTERGSTMWARVKGATENALRHLPFKAVYVFRPAFVQPLNGIASRTGWYNTLYMLIRPLTPLMMWLVPRYATTTTDIGRAMIGVARHGAPKPVLESPEIRQAAQTSA